MLEGLGDDGRPYPTRSAIFSIGTSWSLMIDSTVAVPAGNLAEYQVR
jgi:hypothetical protein